MESALLSILVLAAVVAMMVIAALTRTRNITSRTTPHTLEWGIPALKKVTSEKTASGSRVHLVWQSKTATEMHAGVSVSIEVATGSTVVPFAVLKTVARIAFDTVNAQVSELNFARLVESCEKIAGAVDLKLTEESLANHEGSFSTKTSIDVSVYYPAYSRW